MRALAALAAVSLMLSSISAQADAVADLAGSTYRGTATVEAVSQPDGVMLHRASGNAEITLSLDEQGLLLFTGEAMIDGQSAMRFDHALSAQNDGFWRTDDDEAAMEISPQGEISMQAMSNGFIITAAGNVDAASLQLHLRTNGHAVEPDFVFVFDLVPQDGAKPDRVGKCDHVVWQPRSMANPFGSTMSSVMVPVCIPAPRH
ncbi:MAG: hypothetical protein P0Y65_14610 [Candidatus Devosia phytovorans]|uniref:Uncharacterized protein n=1 Tax=Candidatus Devosia phytovorans TaxID=3121372 RepID=A0AAJ5VRP1_9HYPH|nr:hypothetical protein [Devosia sp.]WEK03419.1 MAG: hypothetical protein P0Y65_14610 [Devosia sp.]